MYIFSEHILHRVKYFFISCYFLYFYPKIEKYTHSFIIEIEEHPTPKDQTTQNNEPAFRRKQKKTTKE